MASPRLTCARGDRVGLAVHLGEVAVHVRELLDRLHHRVADQVGERDLAAAGALEVVVDDDPVVDHQLGRDGPHAGRGRHLQRRGHVLHDGGRRAAQHLHLVALGAAPGAAAFGLAEASPVAPCRVPARRRPRRLGRGRCRFGAAGRSRGRRLPVAAASGCQWSVRGSSRRGIRANSGSTEEGSSRNLRYISSTNHSFCPNGDGELLTAAIRLDSFVRQAGWEPSATCASALPGAALSGCVRNGGHPHSAV